MTTQDTVKFIISGERGSLFDLVGRTLDARLNQLLQAAVLVENAGDSSGVGGAEAGAAAPKDGKMLLLCNKGAMTSHPHTAKTYQPSDFTPLCQVAEAPIAIAVRTGGPYDTLEKLLAAARDKTKGVSFSTPNPYHTQRLALAAFARKQGLEFKYVQLPGSNATAIKNLVAGTVDFAFLAIHNLVEARNAGQIKILGVAHGSRMPFLPNDPTFQEQGYDLVTAIWLGLFASAGLDAATLQRLRTAAEGTASDAGVATQIASLQMVPAYLEGKAFTEKVAADTAFHLDILRHLGALA